MLHHVLASVLEVKSHVELRERIIEFAHGLGFDLVTAIAIVDKPGKDTGFHCVDNAPAAFDQVLCSVDNGRQDPVMQHCKKSSLPMIWDQDTYIAAGRASKWEEQARYGYRTGICVATHLPAGRHFCIGVDRDQPLPSCLEELARMAASLQLFAAYAQDIALRILPPAANSKGPQLSSRELECLRWTTEGKTAWEVGQILSISEQTAVRRLNNATHKLGCVNKHQAAVRALRFGLIE
jgi:DNA-binding CsgD family transcriptional regulator